MNHEQEKQVENVAREIERIINVMGNGETTDALVDKLTRMHRTLIQSFTSQVVIQFIRKMADNYKNGWYDLRDEAACKSCSVMYEAACKTCSAMWDALIKAYDLDEDFIKKYGFHLPLI